MHRRWIAITLALIIAFAGLFTAKEIERRRTAAELRATNLDLRLANLHRHLGVASHEAQRGNFPAAATAARAFFEGCRQALQEPELARESRTRIALSAYVSYSDSMLAALDIGDPAAGQQLASLYLTMNGVLERRE